MDFWDLANIANAVNGSSDNWNNTNLGTKNNNFSKKKKAPFKEQLKNTFFLLKNTFKILWRNKDIIKPTMVSIYYSVILRVLFFIMIGSFFINPLIWVILLLIWFIAFVYKFFYLAKQKSNQSYLVYNTISWNNISYNNSLVYIKNDFNKYKSIAFIDMARLYIEKANNWEKSWIKWMIVGLILSWLEEVLDLISNYLLPAMVIENKSITNVKDDLKEVKNNIPQALVWVFWIDFLWSAINTLFGLIYFFMIIIAWLIGWWMWFISETMIITIADNNISLLPWIISIVIISIISVIILRLVDGVKVVYFTIFYTNIMKPDSIADDLKDELQKYLQFKETVKEEK
jgi:hypothetical protein